MFEAPVLIRDADKLDIYYVVTEYYAQYRDNPQGFKLEVELPDEPRYSAQVVEGILSGRRIDHNWLRTWNDMKLLQLGWVYDVNFTATLERIKQRKFLEKIFGNSKASDQNVKEIYKLFNEMKSVKYARDMDMKYSQMAIKSLDVLDYSYAKDILIELAKYAISREK